MKILECVPNISLANDEDSLRSISCAIAQTPGAALLHMDKNSAANRTVFSFAGEPAAVIQAARNCIATALKKIDMRRHQGRHPRLGAVDVCPLVPIQNISLQEAALLARQLAEETARIFQLPVYLYEAAAVQPSHKNLADIRRGEYESLPEKLKNFPPDFGPRTWDEHTQKTGACVIGARKPLIAFNVNLNTKDELAAKHIAASIREKNGGLPAVKAIGWYMENFGCAQISCNLTDYEITGPAQVFETCKQQAKELGVQATGCELVGLIPLNALLNAGRFYHSNQNSPEEVLIKNAVQALNLNDVKFFSPQQQILEYCLKKKLDNQAAGFPPKN